MGDENSPLPCVFCEKPVPVSEAIYAFKHRDELIREGVTVKQDLIKAHAECAREAGYRAKSDMAVWTKPDRPKK